MLWFLRQSTASQEIRIGKFVDDTDGKTAETGLTIANTDIKIFKAGASSAVSKNSGGATHDANGRYVITLDATDTNTLGSGEITVDVAGALEVSVGFCVLEANVYDALIAASAKLKVDLETIKTQTLTAGAGITFLASVGTAATSTAQTGDTYALANSGTHGFAALKTLIDTIDDFIDTEVAAIKAKTDNLPSDPADASDIAGLFTTLTNKLTKYVQLMVRKDAAIATDNSTELTAINANGGSGAGAFNNVTDSQEAIRDFDTTIYDIVNDGTNGNAAIKTLLSTVATYVDTEVAAILATVNHVSYGNANLLTGITNAINYLVLIDGKVDDLPVDTAAIVWSQANTVESYTPAQALVIMGSVLAGKVSGGGSGTETFKGMGNTTTRVISTNDGDGNRTALTLSPP